MFTQENTWPLGRNGVKIRDDIVIFFSYIIVAFLPYPLEDLLDVEENSRAVVPIF